LIGVCTFFIICGSRFLDPTNVAWLVGGDPLQHYLGWAFFRNGPWTWPVGLSPLYGLDFSNSIVFTDSIPLLAIPFKALSPLLPNTFQYLSIWVLLCFILQAYFAFRLIGLFSNSIAIQCLGSLLFLFSPPLIFRLSLHESLMGHFLLLAALYLNLNTSSTNNQLRRLLAWLALIACASMIHFYLFVMVFSLWLSDLASRTFLQKTTSLKEAIFELSLFLMAIIFIFWQVGYFAVHGSAGATRGFGDFRTNLLALFNSRGWSYWLRPIPLRDSVEAATGEGFQYLGMGSLFLLLCVFFGIIKNGFRVNLELKLFLKNYLFLITALLLLALISFSNNIGFGPWNIRIWLPDFLIGLLSFVRSSARLFWPLYYGIILAILYCIIRLYGAKTALLLITLSAIFQVVDTSAGWLQKKEQITINPSSQFNSALKDPFWRAAGQHYKNVVTSDYYGAWEDFGIYASQNNMGTSITHLARIDADKASQFFYSINKQLYETGLDPSNLYILRDWKGAVDKSSYSNIKYNPKTDLLARIDGFNVLAPGWKSCATCPSLQSDLELSQLTPRLNINQLIEFTKAGNGRAQFMLNGWGYTEDWGTWSIEPSASIVLPMPDGAPTKILIRANAFLTPQHPKQDIELTVNGSPYSDKFTLVKQQDNLLELRLPDGVIRSGDPITIEFRSINAISPLSAGISADDRRLGVGLVSIQFAR
jgi:hypothetical protein